MHIGSKLKEFKANETIKYKLKLDFQLHCTVAYGRRSLTYVRKLGCLIEQWISSQVSQVRRRSGARRQRHRML
jgi:hypothetical protein